MANKQFVKIGYVKITDAQNENVAFYRYEDMFLSGRKRQQVSYLKSVTHGRVYCCCSETDAAQIEVEPNGTVSFPERKKHSRACLSYLSELGNYFRNSPFGAVFEGVPMFVRFNWITPKRDFSPLKRSDLDIARKDSLTLGNLIAVNNALCFSDIEYSASEFRRPEKLTDIFCERISTQSIQTTSVRNSYTVRMHGEFLYKDDMEPGSSGFYYGKLIDIPEKYNSGKGKNLYIITSRMSASGAIRTKKDIFLRVPKEEFFSAYNSLPDKSNVFIAGFIVSKELLLDSADVKPDNFGKINGAALTLSVGEEEKTKKRVTEMRCGRIFSCNDSGLAVFDLDEYRKSNAALSAGKKVYRPVYPATKMETSLMIRNENGDDEFI